MVPGLELVAGYLWAWFAGKAKRVGKLADDEVDRVVTALMDQLHVAITAKLAGDPAVKKLESEAAEGVENERTRRRVTDAVEQAAEDDEEFGQQLSTLLTELTVADTAGSAQPAALHAVRTGAVRQAGGGVNVANTGVVGGDLSAGGPGR
ncbi:hypothetical protein KDK95_10090 [Actinospica sp. MGRD01-02]|uniref:Chromosome partitioning protein n=1 Tax=Actinospica acidithermotolerans TaxID=2828514 RepID=A0A941E8T1_9ACTN|nr:hypothetical protein [Actinospica acidithermotolerans]MBR7826652.1 hypothetical protein [Actinospica acidithermotolerans]